MDMRNVTVKTIKITQIKYNKPVVIKPVCPWCPIKVWPDLEDSK
jgi:hypothetical protein